MPATNHTKNFNVNPARAGMIRFHSTDTSSPYSKPRASGDDPNLTISRRMLPVVNPARAGMILRM